MKINDPRCTLLAGLTLALTLNIPFTANGADSSPKKTLRLARAQTDFTPLQTPAAPVPGLSSTPYVPPPTPPMHNSALSPVPQYGNSSSPLIPTPQGSQPNVAPAPRSPMGLHYGEQEMLDAQTNPPPRPLPTVPYPGSQLPSGIGQGSPVLGAPSDGAPQINGVDRFGFAPPPGTLGQTYKRRSRVIEEKKHPRVGVVEVNLPEGVDVSAIGLKSKWTGKLWRLESDPLLPGVPHIYEIKASWGEGTEPQYRSVRLIMGRIVDLDF